MKQFAHLHLHSQYSLLDGVNKIPGVLAHAASLGQPAIALTDHGNMHGALEFYEAAKKNNIKPILGCELYMTTGSRYERAHGQSNTHHLTVLAKNQTGYRNLCALVTRAYREGFYFKPRVDKALLEEYSDGLIVLSGCLGSELALHARANNEARVKETAEWYARVFKDNYYLEIQPHQIPEQQLLNEHCIATARSLGIPLVATTDCHYPTPDDHYAQEVLMCICTGKSVRDPDRIRHEGVALHLKTRAEMEAEFGEATYIDEALSATLSIAEQVEYSFDFNTYYMPQFEAKPGLSLDETFAEFARDGLVRREELLQRRSWWNDEKKTEYKERLEEEIALIIQMGFPGYFLVVADFINWAKEHDIPVGPGRGSAAGSLVAYCMRITDVDPIENKLLFERFLNPERISMPDIDVDFCINGRDQVIKYVVEKYGKDRVAQIATFGTLKAKAAIKDVGRALGVSYAETDRVAQLVPAPRQGFDFSLSEALEMEKRLKDYAEGEGEELIRLAMKLEGLTRHASTHAAGVVIGDRPLLELLPMMVDKDDNDVTQFSMKYVEKIGLVKFDFLGLKTLTVIQTAVKLIKESEKIDIDISSLPLDDAATYQMLCAGDATGIFQLESTGITEMTMRLKPSCFDDLVAILALYRPGPLDAGMVDRYIERKHGREEVVYLDNRMANTIQDTYGIILYQEQIMQLARELAGYSLGEADLLRRAMGKKNPEEMAKQRDRFVGGATERGVDNKVASEIFDQMETFARYGFNRSHSAAYALISFQTAYLKAHHGVAFMAALMTHEMHDTDKTLKNVTECNKRGIIVLPPDVNVSQSGFSIDAARIRYGLSAVKAVGEKAVEDIIEERVSTGTYKDLEDFLMRVDLRTVNKRVIENLIKCGAFDSTLFTRRELFERLDDAMKVAQSLQKQADTSQLSLFGDTEPAIPRKLARLTEWPVNTKLSYEREALGFYITGHPLKKFEKTLVQLGAKAVSAVESCANGSEIKVGGVVTALKLKNTKKGDRYASFVLEDSSGTVEAVVWPRVYEIIAAQLTSEDPMVVTAKADVTEERCTIIVSGMTSLLEMRDKAATRGLLQLDTNDLGNTFERLKDLFKANPGRCPLRVRYSNTDKDYIMVLRYDTNEPVMVAASEHLCDKVEELLGRQALYFN
jgi:DNA polymerase III subunit alpha